MSGSGPDEGGTAGRVVAPGGEGGLGGAEPFCGDGITNGDEDCDDEGESATCDPDCTNVECGDDYINETAGEQCEDGNLSNTDACTNECRNAVCGDGYRWFSPIDDEGEFCDDGGDSTTCDADCTAAECGDGYVNEVRGEECETDVQTADCELNCHTPKCGDGITNPYPPHNEQCDVQGENADCDSDCTFQECGDGHENGAAGEWCDLGANNGICGCAANCMGYLAPCE